MTGTKQSEALRRAGAAAVRLAREGDRQAAEILRAQTARILALEADNKTLLAGYDAARLEIEALHARVQELERERDGYKAVCDEWLDKTEWVQQTSHPRELGMHLADVLRERLLAAATQAAPVAQGDAWRDLLWQIADALECTPCTADEVLPKVLTIAEEAARYRWLRECNSGSLVVAQITGTGEEDWHVLTERDVDEAIDAEINAARAQAKEGASHD